MWLLVPVIPLWLVYISNQVSRSSLYNIVDFSQTADAFSAMNKELNFGETEYGLLASVAFTALFAVASLGAGIAADRKYDMPAVRALFRQLQSCLYPLAHRGTQASIEKH